MRKYLLSAFIIAAAASLAMAGEPLEIGASAVKTDVEMTNVDNSMVSIGSVQGEKGTLVIFSCIHCPYVKGWETRMAGIGNEYAAKGFGVIMINSNDPSVAGDTFELMQERHSALGMNFPFAVDEGSVIAKAFGATKTPEAFLFDADMKLVYHGTIDDNMRDAGAVEETYLADAMAAVHDGQAVSVATTDALGCSIKFYK